MSGSDEHENVGEEGEYIPPPENGEEDNNSHDGFNSMMRNIMENNDVPDRNDDPVTDPEILKLLEDCEATESYGAPIAGHVAEAFNRTAMRTISKETGEKLKQNIKIPDNCRSFTVPKVNPEIWQNLRTKPRLADIKLQQNQGGLSIALTVLATIGDEIAKSAKVIPKEVVTKILKLSMDGANLIGSQLHEMNYRRRQEIKPNLNADYSGICNSQITATEFLFGDNLTETLKSSKAAASVIRNVNNYGRNRVAPYNIPQRSNAGSLNFQRPFTQQRGRWNGPSRGYNPGFRRQQNFQRPTVQSQFKPQRRP